jgi:ferredoxin/nitrate reductase gamma subunit
VPSSLRLSFVLATTWAGPAVFLAALIIAAALFSRRAVLLFRLVAMGKPVRRFDDLPRRLEDEAVVVLGQRKIFQRLLPGFMHAFIFWGFLVLLTTIAEAVGEVFDPDFAIPWIGHSAWLALVQDVFAVLVLVGLALAVYIRKIQRPERFKGSHLEEADFILVMILGIILTLLLLEAAKIALGTNEAPAAWSPVANALSPLFTGMSEGTAHAFEQFFLYAHLLLVLAFLAYIPFSKHLHIFVSAINVFFENTRPRGTLRTIPIDLEALQEGDDLVLGAGTVEDLTWKQRLDLYSCTECGRCQSVCPAWNTGKPLSPKLIVMNLRDHLFEQGPQLLASRKAGTEPRVPLNPDVIEDEVVWDCTTCGACMRECPVDIEHVDHIVDMRRNLVMAESRFPAEAGTLLRNLEGSSNPWGQPQSTRADWANGLGVRVLQEGAPAPEYLYWVGCAGSFDDRARRISQAVVRVLQKAAVPFAILGPRELCTGDPARRIGNEYLFQELARRNVETLTGSGVRTVITNCPHCFNTLRNEYPDL